MTDSTSPLPRSRESSTSDTAYRVQARNLSQASENKIHDDTIARRFGFQGGLVPGVEIYAYLTHLPVARWGVEWLERGSAECRFFKPVYDGKWATVSWTESGGITVESEGERCATGSAALPDVLDPRLRGGDDSSVVPAQPGASVIPAAAEGSVIATQAGGSVIPPNAGIQDWLPAAIPSSDDRPQADETSLAVGRRLSSQAMLMTPERLQQYLADIGETEPLYARENLVHPAFMLRLSNLALKDNVKLAAWIHAGSAVQHCALAHAGDSLAAHATVATNYERNGHRFVELEVAIVANETRAIARVRHTAIYRLRSA